jgi:AcrR family transcriptional regulator
MDVSEQAVDPGRVTEPAAPRVGLRERKKQQTRETIERVALRLFAERGYEHTTLAEIAEACNVSTRTIFSYFESKEEILFCDESRLYGELRDKLEQRPPGVTTIDALREFLGSFDMHDEKTMLRKQILSSDETLRRGERGRIARHEELIAASIARDLDAGPEDIRPPLVAASMITAFITVKDRLESGSGEPVTHEQAMAVIDEVLEFVRGGVEGLRDRAHTG